MAGRAVVLLAAMLLAVPAFVAGFRVVESQPGFCYLCHEEHPAHQGWLASGAAREHPNCIECHSGPGVTGVVAAQLKGATHFVKHVTGDFAEPIARADVPDEFCTQCHVSGSVVGEHREVAGFATRQCADCHNHKPGARFGEGEESDGTGRED